MQIQKADVKGLVIEGQSGTKTLPRQFIDEALILSDLFDLNEYAAVELLLSGRFTNPSLSQKIIGEVKCCRHLYVLGIYFLFLMNVHVF